MTKNLLVFGAGFSASACAQTTAGEFQSVHGTTRSLAKAARLQSVGIRPLVFDGEVTPELDTALQAVTDLLVSIAPDENGDPVLNACRGRLLASPSLRWVCYLSTVGVYGDHDGAWVSEETPCKPVSARSIERVAAENAWIGFAREKAIPLAIFRLSGIYGPGRNAFMNIENGTSRRLVKPGQVFNRIHRDDIAAAFAAASRLRVNGIFNITDDEPAPPQDVVTYAHKLHGSTPPPESDFATAQISPMARSFYGENKRVSNARSKSVLGLQYGYPDYRSALERMWNERTWR